MTSKISDTPIKQTLTMQEFEIRTDGCYAGIFDLASPVHKKNWFDSILKVANAKSKNFGYEALYHINDELLSCAHRGELLSWVLLFDVIYTVRVHLLDRDDHSNLVTTNFIADEYHDLRCPTGEIAVASLHQIGNSDVRSAVQVSPGIYQIGLITNDSEVGGPTTSDDGTAGESAERSDWVISMRWLQDLRNSE